MTLLLKYTFGSITSYVAQQRDHHYRIPGLCQMLNQAKRTNCTGTDNNHKKRAYQSHGMHGKELAAPILVYVCAKRTREGLQRGAALRRGLGDAMRGGGGTSLPQEPTACGRIVSPARLDCRCQAQRWSDSGTDKGPSPQGRDTALSWLDAQHAGRGFRRQFAENGPSWCN